MRANEKINLKGKINDEKGIFDNWEEMTEVNCNNCECYYDGSCDGVSLGSKKACKSYVATRRVNIPRRLERCEKSQRVVLWATIILHLEFMVYLILDILGVM